MSQGDLLAVDAGLRFGLARIEASSGRVCWHRSQHVANRAALKRLIWGQLTQQVGLGAVVIEGGGPLAQLWANEALKRGLEVEQVSAEQWREDMLYSREQRSGLDAKRHAVRLARQVIEAQGAGLAVELGDDAAEAILLGVWAWRRRDWGIIDSL